MENELQKLTIIYDKLIAAYFMKKEFTKESENRDIQIKIEKLRDYIYVLEHNIKKTNAIDFDIKDYII